MQHAKPSADTSNHWTETKNGRLSPFDAERQCRKLVHKYAIAAGGVSALPFPAAGFIFNDHAIAELSAKILMAFGLTGQRPARGIDAKESNAKQVVNLATKALKSKRLKGFIVSRATKLGIVNFARFTPGVGMAIASIASVALIEFYGHRLVDECLLALRSSNTHRV